MVVAWLYVGRFEHGAVRCGASGGIISEEREKAPGDGHQNSEHSKKRAYTRTIFLLLYDLAQLRQHMLGNSIFEIFFGAVGVRVIYV